MVVRAPSARAVRGAGPIPRHPPLIRRAAPFSAPILSPPSFGQRGDRQALTAWCCARSRSAPNDVAQHYVGCPEAPWEDFDLDGRVYPGWCRSHCLRSRGALLLGLVRHPSSPAHEPRQLRRLRGADRAGGAAHLPPAALDGRQDRPSLYYDDGEILVVLHVELARGRGATRNWIRIAVAITEFDIVDAH